MPVPGAWHSSEPNSLPLVLEGKRPIPLPLVIPQVRLQGTALKFIFVGVGNLFYFRNGMSISCTSVTLSIKLFPGRLSSQFPNW